MKSDYTEVFSLVSILDIVQLWNNIMNIISGVLVTNNLRENQLCIPVQDSMAMSESNTLAKLIHQALESIKSTKLLIN